MQQTINERLKFLIDALKMSARAFSAQLQVPESNTRNYLDKNTKLNSDYLERISIHFKSVNLSWLITGEGELFLSGAPASVSHTGDFNIVGAANTQKVKVTKAPAQELAKQLEDCQRDVESLKRELALANALVAAKDETITLLRASYTRPN